ncbi:MAG: tetratricopeptide repeat protein [Myxococcota bacterium]
MVPSSDRRTLLVAVGLALCAGVAAAAEDPHGTWAPAGDGPVTGAVAKQIPKDGSECVDKAVKRAQFAPVVIADSLTGGPGMQLDHYKEAFAECMVERGWHRVDPVELEARRILGEAQDCLAGLPGPCASTVMRYVHGVPGGNLDPKTGMDVGRQLCDNGDASVCLATASLALRPPEGRGLTADPRLALSLGQRACDAGDAESCAFAGVLLSTGANGMPKDEARGKKLLDRACAGGARSACNWPHGAPEELADASLPGDAHWCRYATPVVKSGTGCKAAPVTWLAAGPGEGCAPRVTVAAGNCSVEYRLGK